MRGSFILNLPSTDASTSSGWWFSHPSEKYENQLGWLETQYFWENKKLMATKPPTSHCYHGIRLPSRSRLACDALHERCGLVPLPRQVGTARLWAWHRRRVRGRWRNGQLMEVRINAGLMGFNGDWWFCLLVIYPQKNDETSQSYMDQSTRNGHFQ